MRTQKLVILVLSCALFLSACDLAFTPFSTGSVQEKSFSATSVNVENVISPLTTPTVEVNIGNSDIVITATSTANSDDQPETWSTYTDPFGFTFEYPTTWRIYRPADELIIRTPISGTNFDLEYEGIVIDYGYLYGAEIDAILQPNYGAPNEGGFRRFWTTTFSSEDGIVLMYVWGDYGLYYPDGGSLRVHFFHEADQAQVIVGTRFSDGDVGLAEAIGLEAIIAQKYPHIQHIIETFRFLPPLATPVPRP